MLLPLSHNKSFCTNLIVFQTNVYYFPFKLPCFMLIVNVVYLHVFLFADACPHNNYKRTHFRCRQPVAGKANIKGPPWGPHGSGDAENILYTNLLYGKHHFYN